jgi:hypothetical protein
MAGAASAARFAFRLVSTAPSRLVGGAAHAATTISANTSVRVFFMGSLLRVIEQSGCVLFQPKELVKDLSDQDLPDQVLVYRTERGSA